MQGSRNGKYIPPFQIDLWNMDILKKKEAHTMIRTVSSPAISSFRSIPESKVVVFWGGPICTGITMTPSSFFSTPLPVAFVQCYRHHSYLRTFSKQSLYPRRLKHHMTASAGLCFEWIPTCRTTGIETSVPLFINLSYGSFKGHELSPLSYPNISSTENRCLFRRRLPPSSLP